MIQYAVKAKEDKLKLYKIYQDNCLDYADGWMGENPNDRVQHYTRYVGDVYAVSEAQAVSRFSYRSGIKAYEFVPWSYDGSRTSTLRAVQVE